MGGLLQQSHRVVGLELIAVFAGTLDALDVVGAPEGVPVAVEQLVVAAEGGQLLPHRLVPDGELHLEGADFQGIGQ